MGEQTQSRTENINEISLPVNCKESCTHICRRRWKIVLLGQAVALVAAIANACSFTLVYNLHVQLPVTELFLLYMTLMIIHLRSFQGPRNNRLETDDSDHRRRMYKLPGTSLDLYAPWWSYGLISLLDVLANSATILSFRYTSLVSTSLLGSLTIPSVMLISWVGFHRHFSLYHFVGAALCLVGGTMTLLLDSNQDKSSVTLNVGGAEKSWIGDALAITAAFLYGIGDCVADYSMKELDRTEYLFMIGFGGTFWTGIVLPFLEGKQLNQLIMETPAVSFFQITTTIFVYIGALTIFYLSATFFLVHGDATLLVLSLQSTQFWAISFSIFVENNPPNPWFYCALTLIISGVIFYEILGGSNSLSRTSNDGEKEPLNLTYSVNSYTYFGTFYLFLL